MKRIKKSCRLKDFVVPANNKMKIKEYEKRDKYLNLELKKLLNLRMTVILVIVGALRTVPNVFDKRQGELEIRKRIETMETPAM